jgi:predicted transposase YbfD/YdcC
MVDAAGEMGYPFVRRVAMNDEPTAAISNHFASLEDPRIDRTKLHQLLDIIVIAICAIICGADDWVEVELFGQAKLPWLRTFLALPHGIPSHDTFGRVFARLNPAQFEQCFLEWVQAVADITRGQVVAIDGKVLRGSREAVLGKAGIDMVSAWATANHLVLGQVKVEDKSNEITAIPKLLHMLELAGCIVTIDAIGCQREIAEAIVELAADYVLAVKENQGHLYEDVKGLFDAAEEMAFKDVPHDYCQTIDKGHGRLEIRRCWTISDPQHVGYLRNLAGWRNLRTIVKVVDERHVNGETTLRTRYFVSSLTGGARQLLKAVRRHWGIENSLHWVLDIAFREDDSRVRKDNGPANFAILRHIALNLLKQEKSTKVGVKAKRLKAGWDEPYLLKVLLG